MNLPTLSDARAPAMVEPVPKPIPDPDPVVPAPVLPSPGDRCTFGKSLRTNAPRSAHAHWQTPANRADPIALLEESNRSRLQRLVPIRYGRMLASPFTYLRGSPIVMAHDLSHTPTTGIQVQLCGDAHLMNFGLYATPERNQLFDVNDFDETLPGPWEWDLKRLAASCVVAARANHFCAGACLQAAQSAAQSYRERMREYSKMSLLEVWYSRVDAQEAWHVFRKGPGKGGARELNKAKQSNNLRALSKLATVTDGRLHIVEDKPLVEHVEDAEVRRTVRHFFSGYKNSLSDDRRFLLNRYHFVDMALKVVGVGSVGTRCYIMLLDASHSNDPLFLQIKEAQASVLEPYVGASKQLNHGHRVVTGQRLMQSASDMFLGWFSEGDYHYYVRQLRDMKASADLTTMSGEDFIGYASLCGWVLARAHARAGDATAISGYLGKSTVFDKAIATFAVAYADQTEQDYEAFKRAVQAGRLQVETAK